MLPAVVEEQTDMAAMDDDVTWWTVVTIAVAALLQIYNVLACGRTTAAWVCPRRVETRSPENTTQQQPRTPCPPLTRTEHMTSDTGTGRTPTRSPAGGTAWDATMQEPRKVRLARQAPVWQILKRNMCAGVLSAMHRWRLLMIRTIQDAAQTLEETEYIQRQGCTHVCTHTEVDDNKIALVVCSCFMSVCVCEETDVWQDTSSGDLGCFYSNSMPRMKSRGPLDLGTLTPTWRP